jgi:hypothetical protein
MNRMVMSPDFFVAQPLLAVCLWTVLQKPHSHEWLCYENLTLAEFFRSL